MVADHVPLLCLNHVNLQIRVATVDDAEAAYKVIRQSITAGCVDDHHNDPVVIDAWLANKNLQRVRAWVTNPRSYAVVAQVDGQILGFSLLRSAAVMLCYVVPDARFGGLGSRMLEALEAHAASAGASYLNLESTKTGERFYRRHGFVPSGKSKESFGIEVITMTKALAAEPTAAPRESSDSMQ